MVEKSQEAAASLGQNAVAVDPEAEVNDEIAKLEEENKKLALELEESKEEEGELAASNENSEAKDEDPDERSVFVKNVDYSADEATLTEHFKLCGEISRVHIRKDHRTSQPLG